MNIENLSEEEKRIIRSALATQRTRLIRDCKSDSFVPMLFVLKCNEEVKAIDAITWKLREQQ